MDAYIPADVVVKRTTTLRQLRHVLAENVVKVENHALPDGCTIPYGVGIAKMLILDKFPNYSKTAALKWNPADVCGDVQLMNVCCVMMTLCGCVV